MSDSHVDPLLEGARWMRRLNVAERRLRQLNRSHEAIKAGIQQDITEARRALEAILTANGPYQTPYGEVTRPKGWVTELHEPTLTAWAIENRPSVLRPPTIKGLEESGATWKGDMLILVSGEIVEGVSRSRKTEGISISRAGITNLEEDDDDDETE